MTDPHDLVVAHVPLDGPGIRVAGAIAGTDVNNYALRDVLGSIDSNPALTDGALADPALRDLAVSARAAHLNIQALTFHLLELHLGVSRGNLNYNEDAIEGYQTE
ncbi:MAG: hypothetical protein JWP19_829 [Rhodoglobus sp.]|nr:hypothetical protein [Rhodoglobus sp.]